MADTSKAWVIADTHFGHQEAIGKFHRPFEDAAQMDQAILDSINRHVMPEDTLYHLGDFVGPMPGPGEQTAYARRLREQIRCQRIILVRGNHDPGNDQFKALFADTHKVLGLKGWSGGDHRIVMSHYPFRRWQGDRSGSMHLFGHVHGQLDEVSRSCDVGIDCWSYGPIRLDPLLRMLDEQDIPAFEPYTRRQPMRNGMEGA